MIDNDKYISIPECREKLNNELSIKITNDGVYSRATILYDKDINTDKLIKVEGKFYFDKDFIEKCISKNKNSIGLNEAIVILHEKYGFSKKAIEINIRTKQILYNIEFINSVQSFLSISDFNMLCSKIDAFCGNFISFTEIIKKLNKLFPLMNFSKKTVEIKRFFSNSVYVEKVNRDDLEFFSKNECYYTKNTLNKLIETITEHIQTNIVSLSNITFEEFATLGESNMFQIYYNLDKIIEIFKELGIENIHLYLNESFFNKRFDNKVRIIHFIRKEWFFNKEDIDKALEVAKSYMSKDDMVRKYDLNNSATRKKKFDSRGVQYEDFVPFYGNGTYVNKTSIEEYVSMDKFAHENKKLNTSIERLKIKIEYNRNENETKYPKTTEIFYKFALNISNNYKNYSANILYELYNILLNNLDKEITLMSSNELNSFFSKMMMKYGSRTLLKRVIISFNNYLMKEERFCFLNTITDVSKRNETPPYTKEEFIDLVIKLIDIFSNETLLRKTYRNWRLSTALGYVFMHLCLCWRKGDIATKIPRPNLTLIENISNGKEFFEWLEKGNKIAYKIGKEICADIEIKVNRLGLRTEKTSKRLICIIPDEMVKEVALILCINEANRQLNTSNHLVKNKKNLFLETYTEGINITKLFLDEFNLDFYTILHDNFKSTRMNKGFMSLVRDKTEELGLSYGYYFAQTLRSHTSKEDKLSNTTKIYLNKDISKTAVKTFAMGTMGSVVYNLISILDENFNSKETAKQLELVQNLNMTPYTIEVAMKTIAKKSNEMGKVINGYLKNGGSKSTFLTELLYGQNSYGIEKRTKCLLKIIKNSDNTVTSLELNKNKPCGYGKGSCIGCNYLISLRYFIYEFEPKFNKLLDDLDNAEYQSELDIGIERLNKMYSPLLQDIYNVLGNDVYIVLNLGRMTEIKNTIERGTYEYSDL